MVYGANKWLYVRIIVCQHDDDVCCCDGGGGGGGASSLTWGVMRQSSFSFFVFFKEQKGIKWIMRCAVVADVALRGLRRLPLIFVDGVAFKKSDEAANNNPFVGV